MNLVICKKKKKMFAKDAYLLVCDKKQEGSSREVIRSRETGGDSGPYRGRTGPGGPVHNAHNVQ